METFLWKELLDPYEQAVLELLTKFNNIEREYKKKGLYSPIESVDGRVKSVASILDKMQRKNISFEDLEEKVEDLAGIRIICQFVEDIDAVVRLISRRTDMEIREERDYLTRQKASGYRSFHVIVWYTVNTVGGPKKLQVEIQIRTMAMNFWATTEHELQYKYKGELPEHVTRELTRAADAVTVLDDVMSHVRSEIMDAQTQSTLRLNLVKEILGNIEGLYHAENKREAIKVQKEFYRIYQMDNMDELERFAKQLDILSEGSRAQSVEHIVRHL